MSAYSRDINPIEICFFISKSRVVRRSRGMRGVDVGVQFELAIHSTIAPEIACALFCHAGIKVTPEEEDWATSRVHLLFTQKLIRRLASLRFVELLFR
jgi:hypothetical protein